MTTSVTTPYGHVVTLPEGGRLVFGRGPGVDLTIPADRGLSRRAGLICAVSGGGWVGNLSHTHALYTDTDGSRFRLPRLEGARHEPRGGWFVREGTVLVGSRTMLDEGLGLRLSVSGAHQAGGTAHEFGDDTLLPLVLDPRTKLYLVALLWCRPWLTDPTGVTPLPRVPEIARAALEVTGASYELARFDADPGFREVLSARVAEHLKVLRRKISERGLVRAGTRLSDEVVVQVLLEHSVIATADLARLDDPEWRSRQEDLWWHRAEP